MKKEKPMLYHTKPNRTPTRTAFGFESTDIPIPSKLMNVAEITLSAQYPLTGFVRNKEAGMSVLVTHGSALFECEGETLALSAGSSVFVEAGKKYRWSPTREVTLWVVSSPPWTVQQQEVVT
jgi:hypothetical protein